jgi:ATP-dependent DNA helicase RecG
LRARILKALPYTLTHSQQKALDDITPTSLCRSGCCVCCKGDVGSGKTVVAFAAAASVIEAGRQAAIMAPTEILRASIWRRSHRSPKPPAFALPF